MLQIWNIVLPLIQQKQTTMKLTDLNTATIKLTADVKEATMVISKLSRIMFRFSMSLQNAKTKTEEMFPAIAITLYGIAFILLIVLYNW